MRGGEGQEDTIGDGYLLPTLRDSDEGMVKAILEHLQTGFYPCETCRLSKDINQGVVNPSLNFHGIEIDAQLSLAAESRTSCTRLLRRH